MKHILLTILRILALTLVFLLLWIAGSSTTPAAATQTLTPEQMAASTGALPIVSLIMTVLLAYLALRSRWHGWRLGLALFLIYFVLYSFLSWIEALVFPAVSGQMPAGMLNSMLLSGFIVGIPFALAAVWILRKTRPDPADAQAPARLHMPPGEWIWKLAAAVVLYELIYFAFGYYVAWRTPGLPEFYGGADPGSLFGQLGNVLRDTPWLPALQIFRGLVWAGIGCIIVAMHKGSMWETALANGLAFSLPMVVGLAFFPNPFMPPFVQRAHTIELLTSNLLWGVLLALLLMWSRPVPSGSAVTAKG